MFAFIGLALIITSYLYFLSKKKSGGHIYAGRGAIIFGVIGVLLVVKQAIGEGPWW